MMQVWAVSRSLAATEEIAVAFSSWGYLDVSVLPVHFIPAIHSRDDGSA